MRVACLSAALPFVATILMAAEPCTSSADGGLLVAAAQDGDATAVSRCLDLGVPVDAQNSAGDTALRTLFLAGAIDSNRVDIARLLLARGANPNSTLAGRPSPLTLALRRRAEDAALLLLASGGGREIDADARGYVYLATHQELHRVLKALLDLGRNANAPEDANADAERPLGFAVRIRDEQSVRLLLIGGANVDLQGRNGNTATHELVEPPLLFTTPTTATPPIARLIAARHPDLTLKNRDGRTPVEHGLYRLAFNAELVEPLRAVFQVLAAAGATDPLLRKIAIANPPDQSCRTPILVTAACANRAAIYAVADVSAGRILLPGENVRLMITTPTTAEECAKAGASWRPIPVGARDVQVDSLRLDSAMPRVACAPPPIALGSSAIPEVWPSWTCTETALVPLSSNITQPTGGLFITGFTLSSGAADLTLLPPSKRNAARAQLTRQLSGSRNYRFSVALPFLEKTAAIARQIASLGTTDIARSTELSHDYAATVQALSGRESDTLSSFCDDPMLFEARKMVTDSIERLDTKIADVQKTLEEIEQGRTVDIVTVTHTLKMDCEWDESGDGTAHIELPPGFTYCSHNITEISNSRDSNSDWSDLGYSPNGGLRVNLKCAGSFFPFDRWGSWVELSVTVKGVPNTLTAAEKQQLGCNVPSVGSGIMCVCSSSPERAVADAYQSGGTGIAHLDVTFAKCVANAMQCQAQYARDCSATLMVISNVPGCR